MYGMRKAVYRSSDSTIIAIMPRYDDSGTHFRICHTRKRQSAIRPTMSSVDVMLTASDKEKKLRLKLIALHSVCVGLVSCAKNKAPITSASEKISFVRFWYQALFDGE